MLPIYGSSDSEWVNADFARQLERELDDALRKLRAVDGALDDVGAPNNEKLSRVGRILRLGIV